MQKYNFTLEQTFTMGCKIKKTKCGEKSAAIHYFYQKFVTIDVKLVFVLVNINKNKICISCAYSLQDVLFLTQVVGRSKNR